MADLLTSSPEAAYATKGNIVAQKAYAGPRSGSDLAGSNGTAVAGKPTAESTIEQHLTGAVITDGSFSVTVEP
jgi:hypothetical protein